MAIIPLSQSLGITAKTSSKSTGIIPLSQSLADTSKEDKIVTSKSDTVPEQDNSNTAMGFTKNLLGDIVNRTSEAIKNGAISTYETYKNYIPKVTEDVKVAASDINKGHPIKAVAKAALTTAGDTAKTIFAPLSGAIGAVMNLTQGDKLTDTTGKVIADKSGITDWEAFQDFAMKHPNAGEYFDDALNIIMSKGEKGDITGTVKSLVESLKKPTEVKIEPTKLSVTQEGPVETPVKVNTPNTKHAEYAKEQGYEPYKAPTELPTIEMGPKASVSGETLPVIKAGESSPVIKQEGTTYEPIKTITEKPVEKIVNTEVKPINEEVKTVSGTKVSSVAKSLEAEAIKNNLVKEFKDFAGYDAKTVEGQSDIISKLLSEEYPRVQKMIKGEEQVPHGVSHAMLLAEAEKIATKNGDYQTIMDLGNSPLTSETSLHAQEMRFLQERSPDSPIAKITEVKRARELNSQKGGNDVNTIKEIKTAKNSKMPTKQNFVEFINSITC